eukprot:evm.model.scf_1711.3 EVM.evm.TU.scf_1711.3   scf_1711:12739-13965(+)
MQAPLRAPRGASCGRHPHGPSKPPRGPPPPRAKDAFCRDKVSLPKAPTAAPGGTSKVTFLGIEGQSVSVDLPCDQYILDAAEEQGIDLPATCRGGICGSCVARVVEGGVDMSDIDDVGFTLTEEEQEQGLVLLCMGRPVGDVKLETQCDWGYSLGVAEWKGASGRLSAEPEPLMGKKWEKNDK